MADEPTGNLDQVTGLEILDIFDELHRSGQTLLVVTHDQGVATRAQRVVTLVDGLIQSERRAAA